MNQKKKKEEKPEITLISVYDNYQVDPDLKTAWGFGCIINTSAEQILFDTGIDPKSIDKVIISHIHGDHVGGGLEGFLEKNSNITVFIPDSFPNSFRDMITSQRAEFVDISSPRKISNFVYTTRELYGPAKEQSLIINSKKGLIVITGCAHPGVANIVKKFRELGVKKVAPSHYTGDPVREAFAEEYKEDFIEF